MTTYALPLPESLLARLSALPDDKRNAFHEEAALLASELIEEAEADNDTLSPEVIAALTEGFADSDAGRVMPGEQAIALLRQRQSDRQAGRPLTPLPAQTAGQE